jgi:hypothetical protein
VRLLRDRYRRGNSLDLSRVIVVLPGKRAGRRLQELLAFQAEDDELLLTPPEVVTESKLPENLYTPKRPFADDLTQDLVWAQVLRDMPQEEQQHFAPHPPAAGDTVRWLDLGKVLRELHVELARDGLDFAAVYGKSPEAERWRTLAEVQRRYHRLLDAQHLWDIQTARLKAIELREIQTDRDIILLGAVDLNQTIRRMLDQVAEKVTVYIVAPETLAGRFDAHGCLVPGEWRDAEIPLRDDQLQEVDGPVEQADAVSAWLADRCGRFRRDEVAIGVPDPSLVPQLQRQLEQCGVKARWVEGVRVAETGPYRLLEAAVKFAAGRRYDDLAALLRHPDLEDRLPRRAQSAATAVSLPAQLDRFYTEHLPSRIHEGAIPRRRRRPDLGMALRWVNAWLKESSANRALQTWGRVFRRILGGVYKVRKLNIDEPAADTLHRTIRAILAACNRLEALPSALDATALSAADAFQIAFGSLAQETLPPPDDPTAVETLGWLELPLDDSKAVVVASFNEGFVPQSTGADAFLPDGLRRELGLLHNEGRFARDAYSTSVMCCSREELRVLVARRDGQDDPLQPSRLVFACSDAELVHRAHRFFGARKTQPAPPPLARAGKPPDKSLFAVPRPAPPGDKPECIPVTDFKVYLACPYRYYLRHVRKLEAVDDSAREMDGSAFGRLLHRVLGAWGRDRSGLRDSDNERGVVQFLDEKLSAMARAAYGVEQRRPAIRLQLEQARLRLRAFAARQVGLVRQGWRVLYAEDEEEDRLSVPFPVGGEPIALTGRIDRIDLHEQQRIVRILDYKTADGAQTPDKSHRNAGKWIDLQLPLYRHMWRAARLDAPADSAAWTVELGYFNLPKALDETGVALGGWDAAALEEADEEAHRVIRNLRDAVFWPPEYHPVPAFSEDLAAICLDGTYSAPALADDDAGDPP